MSHETYDIYLAGPMTGYPDLNAEAFKRARDQLRAKGYTVFCPSEADIANGIDSEESAKRGLKYFMSVDIPKVLASKQVALLPGWMMSRGSRIEVFNAMLHDMPIVWASTLAPVTREDIETIAYHLYDTVIHNLDRPRS